ncbi:MAG TPA: alpha-amylase family glycosyl hydrolase [Candidatus Acidoferrum sp.]|nr:alpha-amylase family glycosyl hydrolase [Candidatus Acidoferrum sp.]
MEGSPGSQLSYEPGSWAGFRFFCYRSFFLPLFVLCCVLILSPFINAAAQNPVQDKITNEAAITKVEPPSWWIGLTPEVMLLISGHNLQANEVACNLTTVTVTHTQSSAGGAYLFVWLKIATDTRSGTAVCRVNTPTGKTSFELPLASRSPTTGKFRGLSQSDVIYLIMPDRFANGDPTNDQPADAPNSRDRTNPRAYHGGDLRGIREHLPYLKDLGVTSLWLTPVLKNGAPKDYHGYGAVDLYEVDPHLGTLNDYQQLVAAAHQQEMKILFDAVLNHVGPNHPWVKNPPLPDWFHGTPAQHTNSSTPLDQSFYGKNNNSSTNESFEALVDPHAPPRLSQNLTQGWFVNVLPDLNTENPVVAQYLLQNSIWWTEATGLDGFRLDTFPYVPRKFWATWHQGLRHLYPNLATIGEVFHPDPSVTSFFVGGQKRYDGVDSGVTTLFDFPLYFTLRDVLLSGAPAGGIAEILRHDSLYNHPDSLVTFFGNHDVTRLGNGANGTGAHLQEEGLKNLKLAYGLTLTLRGIPQLFYGDEIGMTGGADPDNRHDFPGGWSDDPQNAFTADGRTPQQQQMFSYVQTLLRLRREHPVLAQGRLWHLGSDDSSYIFERDSDEEKLIVAFNNSKQSRQLKIPVKDTPTQDTAGLNTLLGEARARIANGQLELVMPPKSLTIFLVD